MSAPVRRSVLISPVGSGCPWYFSSIGLGSKVSTCETPPFMNRKMTFFARGSKSGLGSGVPIDETSPFEASSIDVPTRLANAIMPKPAPMVFRASRRVRGSPWIMPQP